jgi:hypothetical protein
MCCWSGPPDCAGFGARATGLKGLKVVGSVEVVNVVLPTLTGWQ